MKSYNTVMYPGYGENQYWVGDLDASGRISGFYSLTLDPSVGILNRDDMLCYVYIEERDNGDVQVQCILHYMAWPKKDTQQRSVTYMIEHGIINIVEAANAILAKHESLGRRLS